jgi:uncharacterized membrane protein
MTPLPPFAGGYNSYATGANNRGQVVGWAENGVHDSTCNTAFQILQFRAALWEPNGEMRELPPLPGDSTSAATAINDKGQVVGISGACGIAVGGIPDLRIDAQPTRPLSQLKTRPASFSILDSPTPQKSTNVRG